MRYYPIFVNLEGKDCLVVGAGAVGRRKIAALAECGPRSLLVVDTRPPDADMAGLLDDPAVRYETRAFAEADVEGKFIVIASTDNEELNWRVSNLCRERGILCNIVDQPEKCSFIVPATITRGDLVLAISTSGASPALAKKIRRELEEVFGSHYGAFLLLMARVRRLVLSQGRPTDENTRIFKAIIESEVLESLRDGDLSGAGAVLEKLLPPALTPHIPELFDGLA
jgi:precorrin-2 dehydrogenase/sirohydrochlorin ferrochelatase